MRALLYDVHGNLPALEAVLDDARAAGATSFLIGGDVALFGPCPAECVQRLRELEPAEWLRGNGERWTHDPSDAPDALPVPDAIAAAREALGDPLVEELARLPMDVVVDATTRAWHASPQSDVLSFWPEPAPDEDELLQGVTERRLVFGHTHLPFRRTSAGGIELVNPGSIGMPFDGDPRAAYALLDDRGRIEHRRVAYDHGAAAGAVRERYGDAPWADLVARRIEQARFDPV
jgi:diadenosine tetraphosphatase ApaH/serine/threonine PP2A family protein phosphatase